MQKPPQLLPTKLEDAQAPGIRYRIDGELVPVLHTWLDGTVPVYFEHHVVLWKDPALNVGIRAMKGAFKRMVAGMPMFLTEAQGPGESVRMEVQMFGLKTGIFGGGGNMIWNRFTGPGRVGIQSMYLHMPTSE